MTEEELFKNGYEVKEGKLLRYFGFCTSIELPQEINVLGENCFAYNEDINSFTGSKNLKIIEQNAFYGCCNLERVCLCEGLERIEKRAFSSCGLKEISIPQSVKEIEEKAFSGCHSLNKIKLPETLESICDNLFDSCGGLKRIDLPEHLISIVYARYLGPLEFYEKKLFSFIHEFYFCNCIICSWKYFNRPFTNKRIIIFQDNGRNRFTNRKRLFISGKIQNFKS